MLREEILKSSEMIKKYRLTMYTLTAALLAFAFDKNNAFLFLMPFVAIIPLYLLAMHLIDSMMRIGAYLYVFLEPQCDIKWETMLYRYDSMHRSEHSTRKSLISPYVVVSLCCIVLSFMNLDFSNLYSFELWSCLILQVALLVVCIYLFVAKHVDYISTKEKYISEWRAIKSLQNTST